MEWAQNVISSSQLGKRLFIHFIGQQTWRSQSVKTFWLLYNPHTWHFHNEIIAGSLGISEADTLSRKIIKNLVAFK
jgi:hypothetical protein